MTGPAQDGRRLALALLEDVLDDRHPLGEAVERRFAAAGAMAGRDRAFARNLAGTTLRRLGQIDALLDGWLERPLAGRNRQVRHILRLGLTQLLFLETPAHAAVDATVSLISGKSLRGLANAVLRRAAREGAGQLAEHDAARLNTPDWLWQAWCEAYGEETARAIASAHLEPAPLDLTVREAEQATELAAALDAKILPGGTLRRAGGGRIEELAGYGDGTWWVQDAAAALPARLLLAAGAGAGQTGAAAIDLCAAPGGKTAQLAAAGYGVTAVDTSRRRLERLGVNMKRLGLAAETVAADAAIWRPATPAPLVLLDAPCSATGTLRRNPDIARTRRPQDLAALVRTQDALLAAAAGMTAPGGVLVYAVCSLQPEECEARVEAFLETGAPFQRLAVEADEVPGLEAALTPLGDVRTLPCHLGEIGGVDGFYVARLRRDEA